jgi:glucose dehydrogenase
VDSAQRERDCRLYVNDAPDDRQGHAYVYDARKKRHVVAVSFVALNGRAIRVNFDPQTGDVSTFELEH